jgi:tripartite-type tricarboxylate transporter receptor subunit TctC
MIAQNAPPAVSDTLARVAANAVRTDSRHPVVLERQPGGLTTRGAVVVARAARDGHTLLLASNATIVINPHYFRGVDYDPERDLVLVAPLATMPFVLMARSDVPADTPQALIRWLKPRPGEVNYGSSGDGSTGHLAGELFRRVAKIDIVHVSFNGGTAALNGLATRQISLMFAALPLALAYHPNEHFKPVAIIGPRRSERMPGVPTLGESGMPGFELEGWYGLFAPAGSPSVANAWLRQRITSAVSEPVARAELVRMGLEPVEMSFEQFATRINTEHEQWGPVLPSPDDP